MSVFIWLLLIAGTAVHIEGCSHGVHRSAEILVYTDRFQFHDHLHDLEPVRRFAEELQNATNQQVTVHLGMYDVKNLPEHFRIHQGPVRFIPQRSYVVDFINSMTWRPQPGPAHRSHILILLMTGLDPYSFMKPKIHKLKRAGVEIFVMRFRGFENYEFSDIVSYPPKTHSYNLLDYPSLGRALSALARSVCRSIEMKEKKAKKARVGNIRLVNGSGPCDGIVEVSLNDRWNRFCLWNFDVREASVVCRQMGCGPLVKIQEIVMGDTGVGWRTVEDTYCSGTESRISECSLSVWSSQPCLYNIHAGIVCSTSAISKVALTDGSSACSSKVKVLLDNKWHLVPAFEWHVEEEAVLCRQLGCHFAVERAQIKEMSIDKRRNHHTDLRSIYCVGHEASLSQCSSVLSKGHQMQSGEAEVLCSQAGAARIRLVGGDSSCSGRVEVFYQRAWGTVCDDTWDLNDAHVVCRQAGCGHAQRAPGGAYFGPGSGSIWLEKLFCNGNETAVSQCAGVVSKNSLCTHSQDAGVICTELQGDGMQSEERRAD